MNLENNQMFEDTAFGEIQSLESLLDDASINSNTNEPIEEEQEDPLKGILETEEEESTIVDTPINVSEEPEDTLIEESSESPASKSHKDFIKRMVEIGEWEEFDSIELEDGSEVSIEEVEIDDEMFASIVASKNEEKKEKLLTNKVDVEGVSDFTRKLIEIEKSGGNVKQALQMYEKVTDPLSQMDLSTEEGAVQAIQMLNYLKGGDEETTEALIMKYQKDGNLLTKGSEAFDKISEYQEKYYDDLQKQAETVKAEREKKIKEYRTNLKEVATKELKLSETKVRTIVEAATKADENGSYKIDRVYSEKRGNPTEAAELALFLLDKEAYLEQKLKEKMTNEKVSTFKKLKLVKTSSGSLSTNRQKSKVTGEIGLEEI
jgi:hypothetical protein